MSNVSVLTSPKDTAIASRIAEALSRHGHQAQMIAEDGAIGDLYPTDQGDASIVVWSNAALKLARLHDQARRALERGALVPVSVGGARAPSGFEDLPPVDLSGWRGDGDDPRWRFVLEEISIAAGRSQLLDRDVWRRSDPEMEEPEIAGPQEQEEAPAETEPMVREAAFEEAPAPVMVAQRRPRPRRRRRRFSASLVTVSGFAALCLATGVAVILAPRFTARQSLEEASAPLREGEPVNLATLQPVSPPGPDASPAATDPSLQQKSAVSEAVADSIREGAAGDGAPPDASGEDIVAALARAGPAAPADDPSIEADRGPVETDEAAHLADAGPANAYPVIANPVDADSTDADPVDADAAYDSIDSLLAAVPELNDAGETETSVDGIIGNNAGDAFRDCAECPQMRVLEGATFMMGTPTGQLAATGDEGPVKQVSLGYSFAIGASEVTYAEWAACVADGGCRAYTPPTHGWGGGAMPVASVSYDDALAYAAWISQKTGHKYRLPSEAEWEFAARAGSDKAFAWGPTLQPYRANYDGRYPYKGDKGAKSAGPKPAGTYEANGFGLYDMAGNLWEWTADCWAAGIAGVPANGGARGGNCSARVLKGGAWNTGGWRLRAGHRIGKTATARENDNGFRLVREL